MQQSPKSSKAVYAREFGYRLKLTRIVLDISAVEAAAGFGVTLPTYVGWEAGRPGTNSAKHIIKFAKKYKVSLDWLMGGDPTGLKSPLSKNKGGKVAILPVWTAEKRAEWKRADQMWGGVS